MYTSTKRQTIHKVQLVTIQLEYNNVSGCGRAYSSLFRIFALAGTCQNTPKSLCSRQPPQNHLVSLNPQHSSSILFARHRSQFCCSNLSLAAERGEQPAPQLAAALPPAVLQQLMLKPPWPPKHRTYEVTGPQLIPTPLLFTPSAVSADEGTLLGCYFEFNIQLQEIQSAQSTDLSLIYSLYCPSACT